MHKKHSLSLILFCVFLCVIIPLLSIEFAMYFWGTDAVSEELTSAAKSNVVYLKDSLENDLANIYLQTEYILKQNSVNELFVYKETLSAADYYLKVMEIQSLLQLIQKSNSYISEIRLYYISENTFISSNDRNAYFENIDIIALHKRIDSAKMQMPFIAYFEDTDEYVLWNVKPVNNTKYYIEIVLSSSALTEHLSSFSTYSNKNAIMYCHTTGNYLANFNYTSNSVISELKEQLRTALSSDAYPISVYSEEGEYLYVICYSPRLNCSFVQIISSKALKTIPLRFQFYISVFSVFAFIGAILFSLILKRLVSRPLDGIIRGFERTGNGDFDTPLKTANAMSKELYSVSLGYNEMLQHLKQLIYDNYTMTIQLQRAELKQLQAQINPHFLYNSFFFVRHMVQSDENENALVMLGLLSDYFKYITRNSQSSETLESEYLHALNYLNIQAMRFEGRVHIKTMQIPERLTYVEVPRLILQPIFENSFEYCNISPERPLEISISFEQYGNGYFNIIAEDNGTRLTDEKIEQINNSMTTSQSVNQTTGLVNIHKRIVLFFGDECGLTVSRSDTGGMKVTIKLHEGVFSTDV